MPYRITLLVTFLLFGMTYHTSSQTKPETEITIDGQTKLADKYAPFDQNFVLNIPIDSSVKETEIKERVAVFELRRGTAYNDYNASLGSIAAKKLAFVKTGQRYNTLKVMAPPMRPNGNYAFAVQFVFRSTAKSLQKINDLIHRSAPENEVAREYNKILQTIDEFNAPAFQLFRDGLENPTVTFDLGNPDEGSYHHHYIAQLRGKIDSLHIALLGNDDLGADLNSLQACLAAFDLCGKMSRCNCEDDFIVDELKLPLSNLLLITCQFNRFTPDNLQLLARSEASIDSIAHGLPATVRSAPTVSAHLQNTKVTLAYFRMLQRLLRESTMAVQYPDGNYNMLVQKLAVVIGKLETREREGLRYANIININLNNYVNMNFSSIQVSTISTSNSTIKTRAGNYFIPEIGIANMLSNQTSEGTTYFMRPYFGINISFRPINKEIRFRDIRTTRNGVTKVGPTMLHRLSLSLGLTRYSIATNYPEINDLIKQMCLNSGLNWRATRAFRIGAGTTWYRVDNENPLFSDRIALMPYVSLALDVDVVSWASSLTDLLLK